MREIAGKSLFSGMAFLKTLSIAIPCLYLIVLLVTYLFQARLIFMPEHLPAEFKFLPGGQELWLDTSDGHRINGLFFAGSGSETILYLHGNAGSLNGWQHVASDFLELGYSVLIIDYRGYGKSGGRISEPGLYADANAAYDYLRKKFRSDQIIIYGRSIGTGVAVDLCTRYPARALVLESGYTSLVNLGKQRLPWLLPQLLLRTKFQNIEKISAVQCPVLFIHGSDDNLIPASESQQLYDATRSRKKLVIVEGGGHNDLASFGSFHQALANELPVLTN